MKFDPNKYEVMISLAADAKLATWVSETTIKNAARTRLSGKMIPASVTRHGLLVTALVNAMRSVQVRQAGAIRSGVQKPRLLVITDDASLVDALNTTIAKVKAGRNFTELLEQQLGRFLVTVQTPAVKDK